MATPTVPSEFIEELWFPGIGDDNIKELVPAWPHHVGHALVPGKQSHTVTSLQWQKTRGRGFQFGSITGKKALGSYWFCSKSNFLVHQTLIKISLIMGGHELKCLGHSYQEECNNERPWTEMPGATDRWLLHMLWWDVVFLFYLHKVDATICNEEELFPGCWQPPQ